MTASSNEPDMLPPGGDLPMQKGVSEPPRVQVETGTEPLTDRHGDIFFAAVETTRMPMIVTDPRLPDNPIVFANHAFSRMTGYERG